MAVINMILKNVTLVINRIHIRYEDDYYADDKPFAFGLLLKVVFVFYSSKLLLMLQLMNGTLVHLKTTSSIELYLSIVCFRFHRDSAGLIMRETNIFGIKVYWKSMAEMYIPLSLWESTRNSEKQIFDAISLEDIRTLMNESFSAEHFVESFSVYSTFTLNTRVNAVEEALNGGRPRFNADVLFTKFIVNVTPNKLNDLISFLEYTNNMKIFEMLQAYRPSRRPITKHRTNESERFKRTRHLIVRDWFLYGLWAIRLKKALKNKNKSKKGRERAFDTFSKLYQTAKTNTEGNVTRKELIQAMKDMKSKIDTEVEKRDESLIELQKKIKGIKFTARYQEISLRIFANNSKEPIITYQITANFLYNLVESLSCSFY